MKFNSFNSADHCDERYVQQNNTNVEMWTSDNKEVLLIVQTSL